MNFEEKTVSSKNIYNGKIINVKLDVVKLPDGTLAERELVEHHGGVAVLAFDEDGKVLMVEQYRKPYDELTIEVPAGKLEVGEEPLECGMRELHEETGYIAGEMELLFIMYPTPGYCSEKLYIYHAKNLIKAEQMLDEDEYLNVLRYDIDEAYDMVRGQKIRDAKTVAAILMAKLMRKEG